MTIYQIVLMKKFRLWPDRVKRIFEDKNLKILFFIKKNKKSSWQLKVYSIIIYTVE